MAYSGNHEDRFGRSARSAAIGAGALLLALAAPGRAAYSVKSDATTRNGITIAVDGYCNLTEALTSVNNDRPVNTDCKDDGSGARVDLEAFASPVPVYQLASGFVITTATPIAISTPSEYPAVIEAPGFSVLTVSASSNLSISDLVLQHKAGSTGRVLTNMGVFYASFSTFQNGDASGTFEQNGGGIYNVGTINGLGYCKIQNNKALTGYGGGVYNRGWIYAFDNSKVWNNAATQGGGIYSVRNVIRGPGDPTNEGELSMTATSIIENKTVTTEVTSGGTVTTIGGSPCAASESADKAFDDAMQTKWCNTAPASPTPQAPVVVTYQLSAAKQVESYAITSANDAEERNPTDWTLAGGNNAGGPWTVLSTQTSQFFVISLALKPKSTDKFLTKTYYFSNPNSYKYYQLRITRNNGDNLADPAIPGTGMPNTKITQFAELQLFQNWRTGDGGGLFYSTHGQFRNCTISRNIAGCTSASCACPAGDDWCANPSNTNKSYGKGGGIFATDWTPESGVQGTTETFAKNTTVAGNSASEGGGFYQPGQAHWKWDFCIFGYNKARTDGAGHPDFHGNPHYLFGDDHGGSLFTNGTGAITTAKPISGFSGFLPINIASSDPDSDMVGEVGLIPLQPAPSTSASTIFYHTLSAASRARDAVPSNTSTSAEFRDIRSMDRPSGLASDFGSVEQTVIIH